MRKEELELLDNIDKLAVSQIYLLQAPQSAQQEFLHLFAHRTLVARSCFHRNLDRIRSRLSGSFAQAALNSAVVSCFVENKVDCTEEESPLVELIGQWVNYYPSLRSAKRDRYLLAEVVFQDGLQPEAFGGLTNYLTYLGIISVDLWRILRGRKSEQEFLAVRPVKEELREMLAEKCGDRLDANDLLTFISGCIPKTLLNLILSPEALPRGLKRKNFECLYANHSTEFLLRRGSKLGLLLRQALMVLLTMELSAVQQKFLMLVTMRYFYVFHFDRKYSCPELVVHAFNRLTDEVRKLLSDEFALFFKVILKLGKQKFIAFAAQHSPFMRKVAELVQRKPTIGYPQQSASPFSTANVAEAIEIERGAVAVRNFQVLEDYSIFYFRIEVVSLDITVRLVYLGQVGAQKEIRRVLFTHEKVTGQLSSSVNAVRKGLYRFEFDNSYSWINGKRVRYENQVFAPLQIRTTTAYEWVQDFYGNLFLNDVVGEQEEVLEVDNSKPDKPDKPEKAEEDVDGVANVERRQGLLRVSVKRRSGEYVYETDSEERMVQKVSTLAAAKEKYRWQISGKATQDFVDVEDFIRGQHQPTEEVAAKQERQKETIDVSEYRQEEEQEEGEEYEVVEKAQLQRSQIINEPLASSTATVRSEGEVSVKSSKQRIEASLQQLQQAA